MASKNNYFTVLFTLAQTKALTERENAIVELRFGLNSGKPHTLEAIGQEIGVSRERIRQILNKSLRKIVSKGNRELKIGKKNEPCAKLLTYVESSIHPREEGAIIRLVAFIDNEIPHLPEKYSLSLICYLAFQNRKIAKAQQNDALKIIDQRKVNCRKEYKDQIRYEKFSDLMEYVIWPNQVIVLPLTEIKNLERKRNVTRYSGSNSGKFKSIKMDRIVEYESELELDFYQKLEQIDEIIFYQEQPIKLLYENCGRQQIYYPDVLLIFQDGKRVVVEIKPVFKMGLNINLIKWSHLKQFCFQEGLGLLVTDGRLSIQQVQRYEINPNFSRDLLSALKNGPLFWQQYKQILDKHKITRNDFIALILQKRLIWQLNPFKLTLPISTKGRE